MKTLSRWAFTHPRVARCIIVAGHVLLVCLALFVGYSLQEMGITLPAYGLYILIGLFVTLIVLYPSRSQRKKAGEHWGYIWQKSGDVGILLIGFLMVTWVSAAPNASNSFHTPLFGAITLSPVKEKPTAEEILASLQYRDKKSLTRQEKRILRKEFKHQLSVYTKATLQGDPETRNRAGLVILAIIGAVGLTLLLGALVCSISCGGAEGLAVIVGLLGLAAIILLTFAVMRAIRKGARRRREPVLEREG
ncbi:MAG: hypothetical protein JNN29_08805 [Chitinophagaceae bacterium]|nr:hypothetical protein [Chitinophagaceae bacterium]